MRKIKAKAAVLTIAATMLLTACSNGEGTSSPNLWGEGSTFGNTSKPGAGNSGNTGMDIPEILPPEPEKKLEMWDVLPEIPVTDASAFTYEYNSELGGMVVTDYLRKSPKVRIPDTLEGEPVVSVELKKCDKEITELILPDSVTEFGFSKKIRSSLQYVNVPKSISGGRVPSEKFNNYTRLISVFLPDSVSEICDSAFSSCKSLTSVTIPDSVTTIGNSAFSFCKSLTSVTIPDGVTKIDDYTFYGCEELTSVTIPDSVIEIGREAFSDCYKLTSVTIPDGVTEISMSTFAYCKSLTSVTIPDSVTEIGNSAFYRCISLTSVTIPDSVTRIGFVAFYGCTSITSLTYKGKTYDYEHPDDLYSAFYGE